MSFPHAITGCGRSTMAEVNECTSDQWRKRLEASVHVQGGHFKKLL